MPADILLIMISGLFLAFVNGANDNIKGVATLLGSKTASYRVALFWATAATFTGSLAAFFLARQLIENFSGRGLAPDGIGQMGAFTAATALAAALTVLFATRLGLPVSTTHAVTGALAGAGALAATGGVDTGKLFSVFLLPLLVSPAVAMTGAVLLYPVFSYARKKLCVGAESCLCVGSEALAASAQAIPGGAGAAAIPVPAGSYPRVQVGTQADCAERYAGRIWGVSAKAVLDAGHFLSAGLVSFARGLNDTPKIAAILLVSGFFAPMPAIGAVGAAMALGGLAMAKRVAATMSGRITAMNDGQGFTANLVASAVVIGASQLGLPVSTTHVTCGALFGIGAVTRQAHWDGIVKIALAWIVTLPAAALLGGLSFAFLRLFL